MNTNPNEDTKMKIKGQVFNIVNLCEKEKNRYAINSICLESSGGNNTVSAIDIASRKELARIPVGENPKRNITAVLRR